MPLRLKQLELHGYKTFATKTTFIFGEGISAIVGPNGSGKSNIVDSIRWVLGEQSFGLLRGKRTEDMIFAGSELRPRAGMAEASLTFDNSDGWLPIDFSEVTLTRRAYRDGENEYLINGQRVRLRDISDLLAKCGLAERTYTIIGQGHIDAALALKAEERRALFEEAAGIGVYRNRREDALRKLETTQHNLERVLDILTEIKPRLRSLERQAQRARDFNLLKADLDAILKIWYGYHWHRAVEAVEEARRAAETAAAELSAVQSRQAEHNQGMTALRARIAALRAQLNSWHGESARLHAESEALQRELAVADERRRMLEAQLESLKAELAPLEAGLAEQTERVAQAQAEAEHLALEAAEARRQAESAQAAMAAAEAQRAALSQREADARAALAAVNNQILELRARHSHTLELRAKNQGAQTAQRAALEEALAAEKRARSAVTEANTMLNAAHSARLQAEEAVNSQAGVVQQAEAHLAAAAAAEAEVRNQLERLRARHEVLVQARAELAGFAPGTRTLLAGNFPTRGTLAELIRVPPELETAIGAILDIYQEALVIEDLNAVDAASAALGENGGRAALLPLQQLIPSQPLTPAADADCLGTAAQLVETEAELRPAVDLLLGHALIVRTAAAAKRLLPGLPADALVVTLTGEVYHADGPVIVGRNTAPSTLQQARERRDLAAQVETLQAECRRREEARAMAAQALEAARRKYMDLQAELRNAQDVERQLTVSRDSAALEAERAAHNLQFQRDQCAVLEAEAAQLAAAIEAEQAELSRLEAQHQTAAAEVAAAVQAVNDFSMEEAAEQVAHWQTTAAVAERAAQDARARAAELEVARQTAENRLAERQAKIAQLAAEAEAENAAVGEHRRREAELAARLAAANAAIAPAEKQLAELEAEQANLESGDNQIRAALHAAEKENTQAQIELARKTEELEGLRRRIEEDFGLVEFDYGENLSGPTPLPLYPIVEKLERVDELPENLEEQLNRKRGQLRRLGLINPEAEKEYAEVKERHDFLTAQVEDLQAAQTHLREVIAELDLLMERDFRTTFDAVANEFRETFTRLFGGGTAKLVLTDPDHLSTTGVDIQARLPGRRPQSLAMLSGGERSLTACALVFALLRVAPTPFCVLDEVDAMLDEANVGRYRDMLSELAEKTQFIVVTHNRNTVQAADTVYGVTMGADSASQVISLKLDGAKVNSRSAEQFPAH